MDRTGKTTVLAALAVLILSTMPVGAALGPSEPCEHHRVNHPNMPYYEEASATACVGGSTTASACVRVVERHIASACALDHAVGVGAAAYEGCALLASGNTHCFGNWQQRPYTGGDALSMSVNDGQVCVLRPAGNFTCQSLEYDLIYYGGEATAVSAGSYYDGMCYLTVARNVRCYTYYGAPDYAGGDALSVSLGAGGDQACAVLTSRNVHCWDRWGDTAGDYLGGDAVSVSAIGSSAACVLRTTGNVRCYGWGAFGNYTGGDAVSLSAARDIACVLTTAHHVRCWGPQAPADDLSGDAAAVSVGNWGNRCVLYVTGGIHCEGQYGHYDNAQVDPRGPTSVSQPIRPEETILLREGSTPPAWIRVGSSAPDARDGHVSQTLVVSVEAQGQERRVTVPLRV